MNVPDGPIQPEWSADNAIPSESINLFVSSSGSICEEKDGLPSYITWFAILVLPSLQTWLFGNLSLEPYRPIQGQLIIMNFHSKS